ncbi:hypothetical protein DL98DRAFT_520168 [Cadophora sp. DSE1049]|nr:hypothetical protein DL98DRAFT_520168 [Cadophora sp. DSE1049]
MTGGSAMQLLVGMRALSKCDGQGCRGEQREQLIMSGCLRSPELELRRRLLSTSGSFSGTVPVYLVTCTAIDCCGCSAGLWFGF